jgi:hypothetical protein
MQRAGHIRARPLRKMLHAGPSAPSPDALHLRKLWRLLSVNTPRRSVLLTALPNARTPRCSVGERWSVMRRNSGRPVQSYGRPAGLALSIIREAACTPRRRGKLIRCAPPPTELGRYAAIAVSFTSSSATSGSQKHRIKWSRLAARLSRSSGHAISSCRRAGTAVIIISTHHKAHPI